MQISIVQLSNTIHVEKLIIHSLEPGLYQASAIVAGVEYYITDNQGKLLRSFNQLQLQAQLTRVPATKVVLRQQSAYDEMVGQPLRVADNSLEVLLGNADLAQGDMGQAGRLPPSNRH